MLCALGPSIFWGEVFHEKILVRALEKDSEKCLKLLQTDQIHGMVKHELQAQVLMLKQTNLKNRNLCQCMM